jgi:hypothetical protein
VHGLAQFQLLLLTYGQKGFRRKYERRQDRQEQGETRNPGRIESYMGGAHSYPPARKPRTAGKDRGKAERERERPEKGSELIREGDFRKFQSFRRKEIAGKKARSVSILEESREKGKSQKPEGEKKRRRRY